MSENTLVPQAKGCREETLKPQTESGGRSKGERPPSPDQNLI